MAERVLRGARAGSAWLGAAHGGALVELSGVAARAGLVLEHAGGARRAEGDDAGGLPVVGVLRDQRHPARSRVADAVAFRATQPPARPGGLSWSRSVARAARSGSSSAGGFVRTRRRQSRSREVSGTTGSPHVNAASSLAAVESNPPRRSSPANVRTSSFRTSVPPRRTAREHRARTRRGRAKESWPRRGIRTRRPVLS